MDITIARLTEVAKRDDGTGFCIDCGAEYEGILLYYDYSVTCMNCGQCKLKSAAELIARLDVQP